MLPLRGPMTAQINLPPAPSGENIQIIEIQGNQAVVFVGACVRRRRNGRPSRRRRVSLVVSA
jgi:hypothetical protein